MIAVILAFIIGAVFGALGIILAVIAFSDKTAEKEGGGINEDSV